MREKWYMLNDNQSKHTLKNVKYIFGKYILEVSVHFVLLIIIGVEF